MPPKQKIDKLVEEKTFGMKNKNKSSKINKYAIALAQQAQNSGNKKQNKEAQDKRDQIEAKKVFDASKKAELAELFKTVQTIQKVPFGVDPKTVLCQYFKSGNCVKGSKCKFSHDLDIERRVDKIDLYSDVRKEKETDTMDNWDQEKLEMVINKKTDENLNQPTEIVCKFFLEAIDYGKYGWFWTCPNGTQCKYRHALPPGYILKKRETPEERRVREELEKENQITLEDFLEIERKKLAQSTLTPITYESFTKWKQDRLSKQQNEADTVAQSKAEAYKLARQGMKTGMTFSGRELFDFNPDWAVGDEHEEGVMETYGRVLSDNEEMSSSDEALFDEQELAGLNIEEDDD